MSSVAAVRPYNMAGTYTEDSWSNSPEVLESFEGPPPGRLIYLASKALAEKTFWKWVDDNKPTFSTTALNPT